MGKEVNHREPIRVNRKVAKEGWAYQDEHGFADIYIDLSALARRLGPKAAANKSRKTKFFNGILTVEYVKRESGQ